MDLTEDEDETARSKRGGLDGINQLKQSLVGSLGSASSGLISGASSSSFGGSSGSGGHSGGGGGSYVSHVVQK